MVLISCVIYNVDVFQNYLSESFIVIFQHELIHNHEESLNLVWKIISKESSLSVIYICILIFVLYL